MKSWRDSTVCIEDITALLGEKKGPLVNFRVSVGQEV